VADGGGGAGSRVVVEHRQVQDMTWQWQDMCKEGLFTKGVAYVSIKYMDGSETVYDENRGTRHIKDADP
jgi:hypothetical protein